MIRASAAFSARHGTLPTLRISPMPAPKRSRSAASPDRSASVHAKANWPQAWFDEHGGLYPVFHMLRGLARLKGATLR